MNRAAVEILDNRIEADIRTRILGEVAAHGPGADLQSAADLRSAAAAIPPVIDLLRANIPSGKRISYGIYHTVKVLSAYLHTNLCREQLPVLAIGAGLYEAAVDARSVGVALGILSLHGMADCGPVLTHFEDAAGSPDWIVREFAQGLFRKLVGKHRDRIRAYLVRLSASSDPNVRRFVAETLRPVQENRWFYGEPDYPLGILRCLFRESIAYPRTSVGNNLSDLARRLPGIVYDLVAELVAGGDPNSHWIAYRACRNLVKKEPLKVMDLLGVDEYRYKNRTYSRDSATP